MCVCLHRGDPGADEQEASGDPRKGTVHSAGQGRARQGRGCVYVGMQACSCNVISTRTTLRPNPTVPERWVRKVGCVRE